MSDADQTHKTDKSSRRQPAWMEAARQFYGSAFEVKDPAELSSAMHDFTDLSDAEQRFALAHLLYLNLQAQAQGTRLLRELRDTLDEVADDVHDCVDDLGAEIEGSTENEAAELTDHGHRPPVLPVAPEQV